MLFRRSGGLWSGLRHLSSTGAGGFPVLPAPLPEYLPSPSLSLSQLVVVTRHGLRTPTRDLPFDSTPWSDGLEMLTVSHRETSADGQTQIPLEAMYRMAPMPYRPEIPGRTMTRGQLTSKGYEQHKQLGAYLRRRYVDQARFLPEEFSNEEGRLFFRSTQWERTIESLQGCCTGLYPLDKRAKGAAGMIKIHTRSRPQENLVWKREQYSRIREVEKEWKESDLGKQLYRELAELLAESHYEEACWHELYSTIETLYLSGHQLPPGISEKDFAFIRDRTVVEACHWPGHPEICKLSVGNFMYELLEEWKMGVGPILRLYSAHDHTILPLLRVFSADIFHPNMASAMIFEIYDKKGQDDKVLNILLNGEQLPLNLLEPDKNGMYNLSEFENLVQPYLVESIEGAISQ